MNTPKTAASSARSRQQSKDDTDIIAYLDHRIADLLKVIEAEEFWRALVAPKAGSELARELMKEVYLEITSYQPHVIEAAICSIGQMPRSMPVRMIKAMLRHQAEEFDHGEMAMRDYVSLGGDESYARQHHRISPASFAAASVWWMIARQRDPFAYLGALYLFEGLTPQVSALAIQALGAKGYPASALEFLRFHAEEDPKHTALIKHLIQETVGRYPEADRSIREGIEMFLSVYPLPVWRTAYLRAQSHCMHAA